ncbi:MAG: hypothetical protein ED557_11810 [Balneola sp.]|nr:MAG: hypothetical protein ED557_11810 [Balneola sp.]
MKKSVWSKTIFLSCIVLIINFVPASSAFSQTDKLTLTYTLNPALENAQILSLAGLGVDSKGAGPVLISGSLVNNTSETLTNLFFEFTIVSGKNGVLAEVTQQAAYPFTLDPGQVVFATNNDIQNEHIPGVEETMRFDGGLTVEGEEFLESLEGTELPVDIYSVTMTIFQFNLAEGKEVLVSETVQVGGSSDGVVIDEQSIFLKTPGDVIASEATISNPFPQFSWEGDAANTYRVVVVNANGLDSPETLIQAALSSNPTEALGGSILAPAERGSLLEFENLDLTVLGNNLQFPSSGVLPLEPGQLYYWQVLTEVQGASGEGESINSEIWQFRLIAPGEEVTLVQIDQDTFDALITLIGEEEYASLTESGFSFEGIEINDQIVTGATALQLLAEIIQKIDDGDIILGSN